MSVDLEVLRRTPAAVEPPRRGARVAVGAVVVLGALAWAAFLLRDVWSPPRAVRTARVVVETGGAGRAATVFDATGWVEPDPFPIQVRPLVDGVVERFEVVEGDVVKAGETVLARLRNVDLEAEVEKLGRALARAQARLPELDVDAAEAQRVLELKLLLRAEVARLEGAAQVAEAERRAALADVEVARKQLAVARTELSAQETLQLGGGGLPVARARAEASVASAEAEIVAKEAAVAKAAAALEATRLERAVADDALAHPVELEARVGRVAAQQALARAEVGEVETDLAVARRFAALLEVRSPTDGVVMLRRAAPGAAVGPGVGMRRGEGSVLTGGEGVLVDLYDPKKLQVKVNVQLANVSLVGRGQAVELTLDAIPGRTFRGEVVRLTSLADRNNNTLEGKVRILDPDPLMRPEMVVRARFLVPKGAAAVGDGVAARILVPKAALRDGAVFVLDPRRDGRARRVAVERIGDAGDAVEVKGALSETQRVILDAVEDGQRVADGGDA